MTPLKKTLISLSTSWGSKLGGINCFNFDFLMAFQAANYSFAQTVCVVLHASVAEIAQARNEAITLVSLDLPRQRDFPADLLEQVAVALRTAGVTSDPETVWLGHDRITGAVALAAASLYSGRAALIHHMSYRHYEAFAEGSDSAYKKESEQRNLFGQADFTFAVGPLLRDSLIEMLDHDRVVMLVPGMAEIEPKKMHRTFKGFLSGRLSSDAKKVKQAQLGIAAFANAIKQASENSGLPADLRGASEPQLTLRGVDFENGADANGTELNLQKYASDEAGRAFTPLALPYTTDRNALFEDLRSAKVAMMPSWHEGFGLVAWEAIAAGVPVIVSEKSGVYHLLKEIENARFTAWVTKIDVAGEVVEPYFQLKDKTALAQAILDIANDWQTYHGKAVALRGELRVRFSWKACVENFSTAVGWATSAHLPVLMSPGTEALQDMPATVPTFTFNSPAAPLIADLEISPKVWRSGSGMQASRLLRAEEEIIPFDPLREPFLNLQLDWVHYTAYPIAIRLLTGAGGVGKTRLALELCKRLNARNWQAGLLRGDFSVGDASSLVRAIEASGQDCCVVLDYAETRQQVLLALLKALLARPSGKVVRLLLLARDGGEWWDALPRKDAACAALLEGMASTGPYPMPQLHDNEGQRQVAYQLAVKTFAVCLDQSAPEYTPQLSEEQFSHPLYSQMAALMALHGERPKTAAALPDVLVNHERRYWTNTLAAAPVGMQEQEAQAALLMTLASLLGGIATVKEVEDVWKRAGGTKNLLKPLFSLLRPLYPARQGLEGLRPDLLGESLVAQVLQSDGEDELLDAVLSQKSQAGRRASLTVLARTLRNRDVLEDIIENALVRNFRNVAHELVAVCIETPSPLPKIVEAAYSRLERKDEWQAAGLLAPYFEHEIFPLTGLEVLVSRTLLAKAEKAVRGGQLRKNKADYAGALLNLSLALKRDGRMNDALVASGQCLKIYRRLVQEDRANFEPDFATSLNNHSSYLAEQGNMVEALAVSGQALEIRQRLAQAMPERYEPEWATSLSNHAVRLAEYGKMTEALVRSGQALEMRRRLAQNNPERFEPEWATSLSNHAVRLAENGDTAKAFEISVQALEIRQRLAQAKPERFESDWATSLNNYANHLAELGKMAAALDASGQALEIRKRLALAKPERFEPDWAISLINHGTRLAELGNTEEALDASSQALKIRQRLALAKPERFELDWATSLSNHAIRLADFAQWSDAVLLAQQAIEVLNRCASRDPNRFLYEQEKHKLLLAFMCWLADAQSVLDVHRPTLLMQVDARQQSELNFQYHTLLAFGTPSPVNIVAALAYWQEFDIGLQQSWKTFYLLLAALSEHYFGTTGGPLPWREQFHKFRLQRQNRLPAWLPEVARRIGVTLPG
ncbi:tetratricopeptide repeat protein [Rugamonas sp. DEMB1]|uniref:tetratricopeptide repeat protein n=1 Tax=Rugamonas sp. DEMB1 TaxID=3039386 RepID=UPI0024468AAE|nr:tetratricopeptide repeat protein [Rugamonas sp. DEMB1]WGG48571.1 tetratricopeptide repeat protein [Rugamonas sp. DEMB1]